MRIGNGLSTSQEALSDSLAARIHRLFYIVKGAGEDKVSLPPQTIGQSETHSRDRRHLQR